eukprot:COSAG02_NODE_266_length_26580_cov_9.209207_3_plen_167_part_00
MKSDVDVGREQRVDCPEQPLLCWRIYSRSRGNKNIDREHLRTPAAECRQDHGSHTFDSTRGQRTRTQRNRGGFTVIRKKQASTRKSNRLMLTGNGARSSGISQSWQPQMKSEKLIIICSNERSVRNGRGALCASSARKQHEERRRDSAAMGMLTSIACACWIEAKV